ncbi:MAG TPA: c-type cytochrome [Longimicrobiales bacterium]|nr:c-type cytochrome [Longimicrobiales bacterium]
MRQRRPLCTARAYAAHIALLVIVACAAAAAVRVFAAGAAASAARAVAATGAELVVAHRCGACHLDLPAPPAATPLVASDAQAIFALLRDASRHPDFSLNDGEALSLAAALAPGTARALARQLRRQPHASPQLGMPLARALACGACHAGLPAEPAAGPPLANIVAGSNAEWLRGFLRAPHAVRPFGTRPGSGARMPGFGLTAAEADSIAAFLRARAALATAAAAPAPVPPALTVHAAATADVLLDRLSCRGCHSYGGRGGRIGPALDDVHVRRTGAYIAGIIRDPARVRPGAPMPRVDDARVERVVALLAHGDPRRRGAVTAPAAYLSPLDHPLLPAAGLSGARFRYVSWCAACHGAAGRGDGWNAPYLPALPAAHADSGTMSTRVDDTLYDGIAAGGAALGRSAGMPPFGAALRAVEIRELVALIRQLCSCRGPAWAESETP